MIVSDIIVFGNLDWISQDLFKYKGKIFYMHCPKTGTVQAVNYTQGSFSCLNWLIKHMCQRVFNAL